MDLWVTLHVTLGLHLQMIVCSKHGPGVLAPWLPGASSGSLLSLQLNQCILYPKIIISVHLCLGASLTRLNSQILLIAGYLWLLTQWQEDSGPMVPSGGSSRWSASLPSLSIALWPLPLASWGLYTHPTHHTHIVQS